MSYQSRKVTRSMPECRECTGNVTAGHLRTARQVRYEFGILSQCTRHRVGDFSSSHGSARNFSEGDYSEAIKQKIICKCQFCSSRMEMTMTKREIIVVIERRKVDIKKETGEHLAHQFPCSPRNITFFPSVY